MRHGVSCIKKPHDGPGMLHGPNDDRPYDVDGVLYCGRCHVAIDAGDTVEHGACSDIGNGEIRLKPIDIARQVAARVWCDEEMKSVIMDQNACEAIANIVAIAMRSGACKSAESPTTRPAE